MVRNPAFIRRLIASTLLATYGLVGVLGYGLHELFHVHHGHSHESCCASHQTTEPNEQAACCSHKLCSRSHSPRSHGPTSHGPTSHGHSHAHTHTHGTCDHSHPSALVADQNVGDSFPVVAAAEHDCPICTFLAQAQEPIADSADSEIAEALPTGKPVSEVLFPLFLPSEHLARGPPCC